MADLIVSAALQPDMLPAEEDDDDWIIEDGPIRGVTDSVMQDKSAQRRRARLNRKQRLPAETPFRNQFFKTSLCKFYKTNKCQRGNACVYAHSPDELRSPPDLQKTSLCNKGKDCNNPNCSFAHSVHDLRSTDLFYKTAICRFHVAGLCYSGSSCRYAHDPRELGEVTDKALERATSGSCNGSMGSGDVVEVSEAKELQKFDPPSRMATSGDFSEADDQLFGRSMTGDSFSDMSQASFPRQFTSWSMLGGYPADMQARSLLQGMPRMRTDPCPTSCNGAYPAAPVATQASKASSDLPMSPKELEQHLRDAMPEHYED